MFLNNFVQKKFGGGYKDKRIFSMAVRQPPAAAPSYVLAPSPLPPTTGINKWVGCRNLQCVVDSGCLILRVVPSPL